MSTTVSHAAHRQIQRPGVRALSGRRRRPVRPSGSRPTYVMGPANRAPGLPIMGIGDGRFLDMLFTGGATR
jgi:hypothetical protein